MVGLPIWFSLISILTNSTPISHFFSIHNSFFCCHQSLGKSMLIWTHLRSSLVPFEIQSGSIWYFISTDFVVPFQLCQWYLLGIWWWNWRECPKRHYNRRAIGSTRHGLPPQTATTPSRKRRPAPPFSTRTAGSFFHRSLTRIPHGCTALPPESSRPVCDFLEACHLPPPPKHTIFIKNNRLFYRNSEFRQLLSPPKMTLTNPNPPDIFSFDLFLKKTNTKNRRKRLIVGDKIMNNQKQCFSFS